MGTFFNEKCKMNNAEWKIYYIIKRFAKLLSFYRKFALTTHHNGVALWSPLLAIFFAKRVNSCDYTPISRGLGGQKKSLSALFLFWFLIFDFWFLNLHCKFNFMLSDLINFFNRFSFHKIRLQIIQIIFINNTSCQLNSHIKIWHFNCG